MWCKIKIQPISYPFHQAAHTVVINILTHSLNVIHIIMASTFKYNVVYYSIHQPELGSILTHAHSYNNRWPGFHLAIKIWGGSIINEWVYLAHQVPCDVFVGEFLQIVSGNF